MQEVTEMVVRETVTIEKFEMTTQGKILFETIVLVDGVTQSKTTHNEDLLARLLNKEVPDATARHG
jgi:hypothetical protein